MPCWQLSAWHEAAGCVTTQTPVQQWQACNSFLCAGVHTCVELLHALQAAGLDVELPDDSRHLRNQFNFSERAAHTFSYPMKDRATFTEPAPTATIAGITQTSVVVPGLRQRAVIE
jgi:hypothetical protein